MNLVFATASQLARMIREGEVSSVEVSNAFLQQMEKHNSKINAIATLDAAKAKQRAVEADEALAKGEYWGALHGVPITIKDTFETKGLLTTAGYKPLKDYIPDRNATVVERLRQSGAIILGKSNLAEMASDFQSSNELFGKVNNPWNLNYTPGGSSGGSAAAIAAGFSALDLGNDCSGSTRQPAHFCGVYGLMPTDRRISTAGHIPEAPGMPKCIRQLMTVGSFARSIEDLELCLSLIYGADERQPDVQPVPLNIPKEKHLQDLKIAWSNGWSKMMPTSEISEKIQLVVNLLKPLCRELEQWSSPNFDLHESIPLISFGYFLAV